MLKLNYTIIDDYIPIDNIFEKIKIGEIVEKKCKYVFKLLRNRRQRNY